MATKKIEGLNLNYFSAILRKENRITVPIEIVEIFSLKEGERLVFQFVKKLTHKPEVSD